MRTRDVTMASAEWLATESYEPAPSLPLIG